MFYVIDRKAKSGEAHFTDFSFNDVEDSKKALWHSKENAYFGISCFIKDNHSTDKNYTMDRYEIQEEK
jgi:hypothetical protein